MSDPTPDPLRDPEQLDRLLGESMTPLIAFIRARSGGAVAARESAVDLAQSVCREVLQDLEQIEYRGDTAFRSWLFQAASRKILDRSRHHHRERRDVRREVPIDAGDGGASAEAMLSVYQTVTTPSRHASAKEELVRIEAAMGELPADQRDAVMMSRVLGLSYAEIAAQLGKTESSVRGLVARGLAEFAGRLEPDG